MNIITEEQLEKYKEKSTKIWDLHFMNMTLIDIQITLQFLNNQLQAQLIQNATGINPFKK